MVIIYKLSSTKPGERKYISLVLTCPPESFETGWMASDITGSGTFIDVIVYLTDPSVKVSPV